MVNTTWDKRETWESHGTSRKHQMDDTLSSWASLWLQCAKQALIVTQRLRWREIRGVSTVNAVFSFHQTLKPKQASSVNRTLLQKSCGLFRCSFGNLIRAFVFFWDRRVFFLSTLPNKPSLCSHLLLALSWTLRPVALSSGLSEHFSLTLGKMCFHF